MDHDESKLVQLVYLACCHILSGIDALQIKAAALFLAYSFPNAFSLDTYLALMGLFLTWISAWYTCFDACSSAQGTADKYECK